MWQLSEEAKVLQGHMTKKQNDTTLTAIGENHESYRYLTHRDPLVSSCSVC